MGARHVYILLYLLNLSIQALINQVLDDKRRDKKNEECDENAVADDKYFEHLLRLYSSLKHSGSSKSGIISA